MTLRGVSGSGASRTLVLADGVPLNDPFGSWVYWNRIPFAAVDRVEVVRGATGDLYGAGSLGGVVFRKVEPGSGYTVTTAGASSSPVRVLTTRSKPPATCLPVDYQETAFASASSFPCHLPPSDEHGKYCRP